MGRRASPRTDFGTVILQLTLIGLLAVAYVGTHLAIGGVSQLTRSVTAEPASSVAIRSDRQHGALGDEPHPAETWPNARVLAPQASAQ
jgi:hypothetical protein